MKDRTQQMHDRMPIICNLTLNILGTTNDQDNRLTVNSHRDSKERSGTGLDFLGLVLSSSSYIPPRHPKPTRAICLPQTGEHQQMEMRAHPTFGISTMIFSTLYGCDNASKVER